MQPSDGQFVTANKGAVQSLTYRVSGGSVVARLVVDLRGDVGELPTYVGQDVRVEIEADAEQLGFDVSGAVDAREPGRPGPSPEGA